jgi:hypothetical protein
LAEAVEHELDLSRGRRSIKRDIAPAQILLLHVISMTAVQGATPGDMRAGLPLRLRRKSGDV